MAVEQTGSSASPCAWVDLGERAAAMGEVPLGV